MGCRDVDSFVFLVYTVGQYRFFLHLYNVLHTKIILLAVMITLHQVLFSSRVNARNAEVQLMAKIYRSSVL